MLLQNLLPLATHRYLNVAVRDIGFTDVATVALIVRVLVMDQGNVCENEMHLAPAFDEIVLGDDGKHVAFLTKRNLVP